MIDILKGYLDRDWKKKEQIVKYLTFMTQEEVNERAFRKFVADFNENYYSGETELFIAHSSKGYLLTADKDIIVNSLQDDYKRAMKMLKRYYQCKKAIAEKSQLSLTPADTDMYQVLMKVNV